MNSVGSKDTTSAVMRWPSTLKLLILDQTKEIGLPPLRSPARVSDHTTSSGVNGAPSCHFTFGRTSIQTFVLSSDQPQAVSKPGSKERSGFWPTNWSKIER